MDGARKQSHGSVKKSPSVHILQHKIRMFALVAFVLLQGWAPFVGIIQLSPNIPFNDHKQLFSTAHAQTPRLACDVDGDNDVDRDDINAIFEARGRIFVIGDPRDTNGDGVITINDGRACVLRCTLPQCESGDSPVPIANAGPNQNVEVGDKITLNGSASSDPDDKPLTFSWEIIEEPSGSAAVLENPNTVMPMFLANVPGTYTIQLIVNNGAADSGPSTVMVLAKIPTDNEPPTADAGPDQAVIDGATVTLDGSGSADLDGDSLTFQWSIKSPSGSSATLSDPTNMMPTFLADLPGIYVVSIIVNDGMEDSNPDEVVITSGNAWRREGYDLGGTAHYPFASNSNSGQLELLWEINSGGSPAVLTADLNGDDILDVVLTDGSSLSAYDGQGGLLWSVATSADLTYIGDLNGDLQSQICVAYKDAANRLKIDVYQADGTFDKTIDRGPSGFDSSLVVLTNIGDHIIAGYGAGFSGTPRGAGVLSYSSGTELAFFPTGGGGIWGTFAIGDPDNDGLPEIALPWGTPHNGFRVNGTTDFDLFGVMVEADIEGIPVLVTSQFSRTLRSWNSTINPNGYDSTMMPDLNGDGVPEILFLEGHDGTFYPGTQNIYKASPTGSLISTWKGSAATRNIFFPLGVVVNDLNNDKTKELMLSGLESDVISVIDGSLFTTIMESPDAGRVLGATDLNGDGRDEIITHQRSSGNVRVLNGATLTEISNFNIGSFLPLGFDRLNRFAISDITGDGKSELIFGADSGLVILTTN